jgi:hypothetical protein
MKKSIFGNVVAEPVRQSKRILLRFAVDNMLSYYDQDEKAWLKKTKFFDVKIFASLFEQFEKDKVVKGSKLELTDFEVDYLERINKITNEPYEVTELLVRGYKMHDKAKDTAEEMVEKPKSKIVSDKPILQYKPDENSEEDGNPSWMNE